MISYLVSLSSDTFKYYCHNTYLFIVFFLFLPHPIKETTLEWKQTYKLSWVIFLNVIKLQMEYISFQFLFKYHETKINQIENCIRYKWTHFQQYKEMQYQK